MNKKSKITLKLSIYNKLRENVIDTKKYYYFIQQTIL